MTDESEEGTHVTTMSSEEYEDGVNSNMGICTDCGETVDEFYEPDRRGGHCYSCNGHRACGYEHALVCGLIEFEEDEEDAG